MGLTNSIIYKPCLDKLNTLETREPHLEITEEKKDGLDIYKIDEHLFKYLIYSFQIACPICKQDFPSKEKNIINSMLNKGTNLFRNLFYKYKYYINKFDIDIFYKLEGIYYKIETARINLEKNRYYKHCCKVSGGIIFYIDLIPNDLSIFNLDKYLDFFKLSKYSYNKWKNNINYKDELLKERKRNKEIYENCDEEINCENYDWDC